MRLFLCCVVLVAAAICASCTPAHSHPTALAAPEVARPDRSDLTVPMESRQFVRIEPVTSVADWPVVRAPGRIVFREGSLGRIGATVTARVDLVHVTVGQRVRKDDPLVTLESPEAISLRAAARATHETEVAAREELRRVRALSASGVANEREVLEAELRAASAGIDATRALSSIAWIGNGGGRRVIVRSPMDGVVLSVDATIGAVVTADSHVLVEVGDPSRVHIECDVFQSNLGEVNVGQTAIVHFGTDGVVRGSVVSEGAEVRAATRTALVRVEVDALPASLRPGAYVRVDLESPAPTVVVPASAIVIREGRDYAVYVESTAGSLHLERRLVTVGTSFDGRVAVLQGLEAGERVVVEGTLLIDGAVDQLL